MRKTFGTKTVGGDTKENKRISFCLFNVIRMRFLGGLHQLLFVTFEDVGGSPSVNGVNNLSSMMGLCHHAQPALSGLCSRLVGYRSPTRQFFSPFVLLITGINVQPAVLHCICQVFLLTPTTSQLIRLSAWIVWVLDACFTLCMFPFVLIFLVIVFSHFERVANVLKAAQKSNEKTGGQLRQ